MSARHLPFLRAFAPGPGRQFVIFAAMGSVGTLCHYATMAGLIELGGVRAVPATMTGALVGALVNYRLNYRHTFRSRAEHRATLPRFLAVAAFGFGVNASIVFFGVAILAIHYMLAQIAATATVLVLGFVINRFWTFGGARGASGG